MYPFWANLTETALLDVFLAFVVFVATCLHKVLVFIDFGRAPLPRKDGPSKIKVVIKEFLDQKLPFWVNRRITF